MRSILRNGKVRLALIATILAVLLHFSLKRVVIIDDQAEAMRHKVEESVYMLEGQESRGTGFVVETDSGKKFMVTNSHVCDQPTPIMIATDSKGDRQSLMVLKHYDDHDLCILTPPANAKPIPLADAIRADERVFVVGYPLIRFMTSAQGYFKGYDLTNIQMEEIPIKKCTLPKLRVVEYEGEDDRGKPKKLKVCLMSVVTESTTVQSDRGASGSPLLNAKGEVVGVVMAVGGGVSWTKAVPLQALKKFINSQ